MKIIISHDVDHLYVSDHLKRDLIIEKLLIRSFVQLVQKKISFKTFRNRLLLPFHNRMNRLTEVMDFDEKHAIPSVFFFGMTRGLGMSYIKEQAKPEIKGVIKRGFDVGVHGIDFCNQEGINSEYNDFNKISGLTSFGIRNHYVRYDNDTFRKQSEAGYLFDSSWFDKKGVKIKKPYKVNNMWEFPLHIMDVYVCEEGNLYEGVQKTIKMIEKARQDGLDYCTILFHDYQFDKNLFPDMRKWYIEVVNYCHKKGYTFISYRDAIRELENQ